MFSLAARAAQDRTGAQNGGRERCAGPSLPAPPRAAASREPAVPCAPRTRHSAACTSSSPRPALTAHSLHCGSSLVRSGSGSRSGFSMILLDQPLQTLWELADVSLTDGPSGMRVTWLHCGLSPPIDHMRLEAQLRGGSPPPGKPGQGWEGPSRHSPT